MYCFNAAKLIFDIYIAYFIKMETGKIHSTF